MHPFEKHASTAFLSRRPAQSHGFLFPAKRTRLRHMAKDDFSHITTWVFDLDNTLYDPSVRLFDQIEVRMADYVARVLNVSLSEAHVMRASYWEKYGTTLAGLMREHDMDPDPYLEDVHDISFDSLSADPDLRALILSLPGRRIVYTNGTAPYAENVLEARGLNGLFDAIYGIEHASYLPKPEHAAFEQIFAKDGVTTTKAAMFEDDHRNLKAPHDMGMRTVHVAPDPHDADHIHYHTSDLSGFLQGLI
jgi:putative hydrolase of the HAD superfamily